MINRDVIVAGALLLSSLLLVSRHVGSGVPVDVGARIELAWEMQARRALDEGTVPLWNPYQFGGQPHFADPRSLALYPPHVLLRFVPIELFFPASVFLHVWLASLGTYWIGRQLHASRTASLFGALGLLALLMPTSATAYSSDVYAVSWLPLVIACAMRSTAIAEGLRPHPGLVGATSLAALTGSWRAVLYGIGTVLAVYGYGMLWTRISGRARLRLLTQFVALCVLTAGITAYQTVPTAHLGAVSAGSVRYDDARMQQTRKREATVSSVDSPVAAALHPLRGHRTATVCEGAVDPSQLAMLRIPVAGGQGGMYPADLAHLVNLTTAQSADAQPVYRGMAGIDNSSARSELLKLLGVEYLISCDAADSRNWTLVTQVDRVAIYRNVRPIHRARWTCPPRLVSRSEIYDALSRLGGAVMNVRWSPDVDDQRRARAEATLRLRSLRGLGDRTWQYEVDDTSPEHLAAILRSPEVEDTHGVDRATRTVVPLGHGESEAKTEWLATDNCSDVGEASVLEADRGDGRVVLSVNAPHDGVVFVSETYYPVRGARVDGRDVEPLKLNLVFTGVPVTAGVHVVELRYKDGWFRVGAGISLVTLVVWALLGVRTNQRALPQGRLM